MPWVQRRRRYMKPSTHGHHGHHPLHHGHTVTEPIVTDLAALHAARSGPAPSRTAAARTPQEVHVQLTAGEVAWELAPGRTVAAWGYEGTVPGPLIVAHVGDTLVAHLTNRLPEPTVIHWHGVRLPAAMDGTDSVQTLVEPGASFEYRFVLPDAGTYWYHSHANETVQIERGLYGAIVVLGPDEPVYDADRVLVLDDVKLDRIGRIAGTALFDRHSGREGGIMTINGRATPDLAITAGHVERWRLVNASNSRYVRLSLGGRLFRILGSGAGAHTEERTVTETLLVPGGRIELAVGPFEAESGPIAIESLPYRRSRMKWPRRTLWGRLHVQEAAVGTANRRAATPPSTVEPLVTGAVVPTRTVRLGARMTLHGHDWLVNGETHHRDAPVKVGELQVWDVVNDSGLDHPFHLHGFFFQVVAIDGVATTPRSWEDTVNIAARRRVTIAFRADDRPGEWMYHCHILEHHAAGMMGHFQVVR